MDQLTIPVISNHAYRDAGFQFEKLVTETQSVIATVRTAWSSAELSSIWSIRLALLLLVVVVALQIRGMKPTSQAVSCLWFLGALLSLAHSIGSLLTFHHGSLNEAFEDTAKQTEALLGFRFGAGIYVNYAFVMVWLADAIMRVLMPMKYDNLPRAWMYASTSFLIFIAINGAIVFHAGWPRLIGSICLAVLAWLAWSRRWTVRKSTLERSSSKR